MGPGAWLATDGPRARARKTGETSRHDPAPRPGEGGGGGGGAAEGGPGRRKGGMGGAGVTHQVLPRGRLLGRGVRLGCHGHSRLPPRPLHPGSLSQRPRRPPVDDGPSCQTPLSVGPLPPPDRERNLRDSMDFAFSRPEGFRAERGPSLPPAVGEWQTATLLAVFHRRRPSPWPCQPLHWQDATPPSPHRHRARARAGSDSVGLPSCSAAELRRRARPSPG